jgi:hypothetical protein
MAKDKFDEKYPGTDFFLKAFVFGSAGIVITGLIIIVLLVLQTLGIIKIMI